MQSILVFKCTTKLRNSWVYPDKDGHCAYKDMYPHAPVDENGEKLPISEKMCICTHFMKYNCYTCGHNVYRLKDTTTKMEDGKYLLPPMEDIFLGLPDW